MLDSAVSGFAALPPPIVAGMKRPWWEVLGVPQNSTREQVKQAYRELASEHHPDRGGDPQRMAEINAAHDEALGEVFR
jgi:curved DNA-binding protein CbpA